MNAAEIVRATLKPSRAEFDRLAQDANLIPVYVELHADLLTPISAYLLLAGGGHGFLLESVEGGEKVGRYSFIGIDPWTTLKTRGENPLVAVQQQLAPYRIARIEELPRFLGGAVGFLGYDSAAYFEPHLAPAIGRQRVAENLDLPEAAFMICGKLVVFDHLRKRLQIIVNMPVGAGGTGEAYAAGEKELVRIVEKLHGSAIGASAVAVQPAPERLGRRSTADMLAGVTSDMTRDAYCAAVRRAKEYIAAGDIFQVVLSHRFSRPITASAFDCYRAIRAMNPSPYMFFLDFGEFALAGSSPEVMVRLEDGQITLRPIAGTRPRGRDEAEDARLAAELLADEKERAEHIMLVDLGRNDVGRVAAPGTVKVDELMTIERYSHVMHIVSNVTGELSPRHTPYDVISSAFPAGTVSGAPKIRAMEIIAELEASRRGAYAGAVGYIGFDGNADTAIVLRTALIAGGRAYVQAGAGIVFDSVPEREYDETVNKAAAMLRALDWAEGGSR